MLSVAGLELPVRQKDDSDLTERQTDYVQSFLVDSGFAPLDDEILDVLSQEQAQQLVDQVDSISDDAPDDAAIGLSGTIIYIVLAVITFLLALK